MTEEVQSPPPVSAAHPSSGKKPATSGDIDLGSWQKKLSSFASSPILKQPQAPALSKNHSYDSTGELKKVASLASLKVEWQQFLDHLAKKTHNFMATHLQSCELVSCSPSGVLEIACCRKFSYEELLQDKATLEQEISEFYVQPFQLHIFYDVEKDACTKEKTVFTLFQELSQSNEVVKVLIAEFGGELVY